MRFSSITTPTFGPGGNGEWFKQEGGKSTTQAPGWLQKKGLDAYEYEAGKGIMAGEGALLAIGQKAHEHGILMSLHAPYFISLSSVEAEKRDNSIGYIQKSLWAAELLGADTIVIHSGSAGKISREEAMNLSCDTLYRLMETVGNTPIRLGIETMGKRNQLGTLEEVRDSYRRVFHTIADSLGAEYASHLHCHFSKIEYTDAGEKRHVTFEDTVYGPAFEPLMEAIIVDGLCPRIICESDGTMAEDALAMKQYWLDHKDP